MEPSPSREMKSLIARIAANPRGLALLHLGDPEFVAVRFGVHPFVVVEAKEFLETPQGRDWLIREFRQAHARCRKTAPAEPGPAPHAAPPHSASELIRAATHRPNGVAFLEEASPEFVAVTFQVHPDLVFRAREVLSRWKASSGRT